MCVYLSVSEFKVKLFCLLSYIHVCSKTKQCWLQLNKHTHTHTHTHTHHSTLTSPHSPVHLYSAVCTQTTDSTDTHTNTHTQTQTARPCHLFCGRASMEL